MEAHLCKCNMCNTTFIDQNSQVGAKLHNIEDNQYSDLSYLQEDGEYYWGCPICNTDAYLIDL